MKRPPAEERVQGAVEYALILVLVAVIFVVALIVLGPSLEEFISRLMAELLPA